MNREVWDCEMQCYRMTDRKVHRRGLECDKTLSEEIFCALGIAEKMQTLRCIAVCRAMILISRWLIVIGIALTIALLCLQVLHYKAKLVFMCPFLDWIACQVCMHDIPVCLPLSLWQSYVCARVFCLFFGICALYNFLRVCWFMHRCANLSLMGFFCSAGASTAMCQTCLLSLPLCMRESSVPQWTAGNAVNENWQVFLRVCVCWVG